MVNLKISSYAQAGQIDRERLVLKAMVDLNVGEYAILCSGALEGDPTAGANRAYWFADYSIKSGDLVVLYTKKGDLSAKVLDKGNKAHFFYWGLSEPIWDAEHIAVVLFAPEFEYPDIDIQQGLATKGKARR